MTTAEDATVTWAAQQLVRLVADLDEDTATDLARYMYGIKDERELREYIADVVGESTQPVINFQSSFLKRRSAASTVEEVQSVPSVAATPSPILSKAAVSSAVTTSSATTLSSSSSTTAKVTTNDNSSPSMPTPSIQSNPLANAKPASSFMSALSASSSSKPGPWSGSAMKKTKPKFVDFMDKKGDAIVADLVPGRQWCECLATKHSLVNNCLQCGRIVCEQEGMGPCMVCGALVVTPEKQKLLTRNTKAAQKFLDQIMQDCKVDSSIDREVFRQSALFCGSEQVTDSLARALARKDMLLDFDRNSAKRTRVIDDEADYFSTDSNKWLSRKQRDELQQKEEELRQQRHDARRNRMLTIDFAGRRIVDTGPQVVDVYALAREQQEHEDNRQADTAAFNSQALAENPMLSGGMERPIFVSEKSKPKKKPSEAAANGTEAQDNVSKQKHATRLQDSALSEMTDEGLCLSMHQPWASLLVQGIKMHEGRTWYSPHRGRLWIAAASKQYEEEEIRAIEQQLRDHHGRDFDFPTEYPTSCLLGFVDVKDVLPQDEYRKQYPNGPSAMDFVFICENPHELIVRYPIKGQHKIWKLDKATHAGAKMAVRPVIPTDPSNMNVS
eukprot:m.144588 g.144588  ORF g.144588 m.144588 type:complete len:614 (-) comp16045_c2_seq1:107-1948(-)